MALFWWILDMAFISLHAKFQLSSSTIVNVAAHGMIIRLGLMLPPYDSLWSLPLCSGRVSALLCLLLILTAFSISSNFWLWEERMDRGIIELFLPCVDIAVYLFYSYQLINIYQKDSTVYAISRKHWYLLDNESSNKNVWFHYIIFTSWPYNVYQMHFTTLVCASEVVHPNKKRPAWGHAIR